MVPDRTFYSLLAFVLVCTALLYFPALSFGLVWDDETLRFLRNFYLRHDFLRLAFLEPYGLGSYYRPLPVFLIAIESSLFGVAGSAVVGHAINLALLLGNGVLVVFLVRHRAHTATEEHADVLALVCGTFYLLHPVLVSGAGWISTRFDLMFTLMALAMFHVSLRGDARERRLLSAMFFALALLCKETALVLLVIYPLWRCEQVVLPRTLAGKARCLWVEAWPLAAVLALYLALRIAVTGVGVHIDMETEPLDFVAHLVRTSATLGWIAHLLGFPFTAMQVVFPPELPYSFASTHAMAGLSTIVAGTVLWYLGNHGVRLAILLVAISILPVMNLLFLQMRESLTATWYLFFPLALLTLLVLPSALSFALARSRYVTVFVLAMWFAACVWTDHRTLAHWRNNVTFWEWYVATAPRSSIAHFTLAQSYFHAGRFDAAWSSAKRAEAAGSDDPVLVHALGGFALLRMGKADAAEIQLVRAQHEARTASETALCVSGLAEVAIAQGRDIEAQRLVEQSLDMKPDHPYTLVLAAELALARGDRERFVAIMHRLGLVIDADPAIRALQFRDFAITETRWQALVSRLHQRRL